MTALLIVESMFGNTYAVAQAIADGLSSSGEQTQIVTADVADPRVPVGTSLLVLGTPTHNRKLPTPATRREVAAISSQPIMTGQPARCGLSEWIEAAAIPPGVPVVVFDTRNTRAFAGSAAEVAVRALHQRGAEAARIGEQFRVEITTLVDGELERARAWGKELGTSLLPSDRARAAALATAPAFEISGESQPASADLPYVSVVGQPQQTALGAAPQTPPDAAMLSQAPQAGFTQTDASVAFAPATHAPTDGASELAERRVTEVEIALSEAAEAKVPGSEVAEVELDEVEVPEVAGVDTSGVAPAFGPDLPRSWGAHADDTVEPVAGNQSEAVAEQQVATEPAQQAPVTSSFLARYGAGSGHVERTEVIDQEPPVTSPTVPASPTTGTSQSVPAPVIEPTQPATTGSVDQANVSVDQLGEPEAAVAHVEPGSAPVIEPTQPATTVSADQTTTGSVDQANVSVDQATVSVDQLGEPEVAVAHVEPGSASPTTPVSPAASATRWRTPEWATPPPVPVPEPVEVAPVEDEPVLEQEPQIADSQPAAVVVPPATSAFAESTAQPVTLPPRPTIGLATVASAASAATAATTTRAETDERRDVPSAASLDWMSAVGELDWGAHAHAFGPAHDVPDMLRRLADPDQCDQALDQLSAATMHDGALYDVTPCAAVCVARLAAQEDAPDRIGLLSYLASFGLAVTEGRALDQRTLPGVGGPNFEDDCRETYLASLGAVLSGISDPRQEVRSTMPLLIDIGRTMRPEPLDRAVVDGLDALTTRMVIEPATAPRASATVALIRAGRLSASQVIEATADSSPLIAFAAASAASSAGYDMSDAGQRVLEGVDRGTLLRFSALGWYEILPEPDPELLNRPY